jgi:hypothetical protein
MIVAAREVRAGRFLEMTVDCDYLRAYLVRLVLRINTYRLAIGGDY